jgi:glutamate-1-semialdehyde 2,1-aminomutase
MSRQRSHQLYQRACQLMPGGVNSAARAFGGVGGEPIVMARASGSRLFDVDGNSYIDYIGSWGPMIFGHAFSPVIEAVRSAAERSTSFGAPTEAENELAERIIECVPSIEMVRLVNSGTEATMSAIRLARGFTGREKIIKFSGNYHGHVDSLLVAAGSAAATLGVPSSPGVTAGAAQDTIILPYNDSERLINEFKKQGHQIAAVIFEPICGNMGCVLPHAEFLRALQTECNQVGALLICDEVMTGFRVSRGGAQELLNFRPDLTTLGKIVGGGLPLGAFGGRRDVMQHVLPAGKVFQAGTLSGNPIATAAGIAMLKALCENPPYAKLERTSQRLAEGLQKAAAKFSMPTCVQRVGSMMTLFFHAGPIVGWDSASRSDVKRFSAYFWSLIEQGVYMPCSQFEALFVSAAHTDADIDQTIMAAESALQVANDVH